ncbi:MAG: hypothetical protein WBU92_01020 [Candidatus Dormiibacterota bacterium]
MADVSDHARTKLELVQEAIQLALGASWEEAVRVNRQIRERFGDDEETANRLGKALMESGDLGASRSAYAAALELNPLNQIAKRQLAKLAELEGGKGAAVPGEAALPPRFFTEEPGKTTMTRLTPGGRVDPAQIAPGDAVELTIGPKEVSARSLRGVDLGVLEPRLAQRLRQLMAAGGQYQGGVTRVEAGSVQILIREMFQPPEAAGTVAFPVRKGKEAEYRPYAKEALLARDSEPVPDDDEDSELLGSPPVRSGAALDEGFGEFGDDDTEEVDGPAVDEHEDLDEEEEF